MCKVGEAANIGTKHMRARKQQMKKMRNCVRSACQGMLCRGRDWSGGGEAGRWRVRVGQNNEAGSQECADTGGRKLSHNLET